MQQRQRFWVRLDADIPQNWPLGGRHAALEDARLEVCVRCGQLVSLSAPLL